MTSLKTCPVCKNLTDGFNRTLFRKLQSSARRGCVLCNAVCQAITASGADLCSGYVKEVYISAWSGYPVKIQAFQYTTGKEYVTAKEIALSGTTG
jgi:hypothetical protein